MQMPLWLLNLGLLYKIWFLVIPSGILYRSFNLFLKPQIFGLAGQAAC